MTGSKSLSHMILSWAKGVREVGRGGGGGGVGTYKTLRAGSDAGAGVRSGSNSMGKEDGNDGDRGGGGNAFELASIQGSASTSEATANTV